MRTLLLAFTAVAGLSAAAGLTGDAQAQTNAPTHHAVGPDTGKAKSTPDTTQIPGSSTTGNATGPGGTTSAAAPTLPQGPGNSVQGGRAGATTGSTKGVVPSPPQ